MRIVIADADLLAHFFANVACSDFVFKTAQPGRAL
jgi:hypothetical protein